MEPLVFQIIDWRDSNEEQNIPEEYVVPDNEENLQKYVCRIYGRTLSGESVHAKCLNYIPHFYIKVPDFWKTHIKVFKNGFVKAIKDKNKKHGKHIVDCEILTRHEFRGFTAGESFEFIRLSFNNSYAMRQIIYHIQNNNIAIGNQSYQYQTYETSIDSILRFAHIRKINMAGWIEIRNYIDNNDYETSTCDINVVCDWQAIFPNDTDTNAPFKILSYDIECYSEDGSFPSPERQTDKIIQIGSVFSIYGKGIYKKHIITLGSCDEIDGVEVVAVRTEKELLMKWNELIRNEDPDILLGYNIFGFDDYYINSRACLKSINC